MAVSQEQVLAFIVANNGVVLKDWARSPSLTRLCRAVFPAESRRRPLLGLRSPFIRKALNEFYPNVDAEKDLGNAIYVPMGNGKTFLVLESNLEMFTGRLVDERNVEYPAYGTAKKSAIKTVFLGHPGVWVQQEGAR